jgi:hypothetical protein
VAQATEQQKRAAFIEGLRQIADALENHTELRIPYVGSIIHRVEDLGEMLAVGKAFGGKWEKNATDYGDFQLIRRFSDDLQYTVYTARENVCTRVVTGTKHVPEKVVEARPASVVPAHVEDVVEWHCPGSLTELVKQQKQLVEPELQLAGSDDDEGIPF